LIPDDSEKDVVDLPSLAFISLPAGRTGFHHHPILLLLAVPSLGSSELPEDVNLPYDQHLRFSPNFQVVIMELFFASKNCEDYVFFVWHTYIFTESLLFSKKTDWQWKIMEKHQPIGEFQPENIHNELVNC